MVNRRAPARAETPSPAAQRHIDALKPLIYQCNRCGQCLDFSTLGLVAKCPAYGGGLFESFASRGKFNIARALVDGLIDYDEELARRVYSCTECRACAENCFKFLDTTAIFTAMKQDLAERGLIPENYQRALEGEMGLDEVHNVYQAPHAERLVWLAHPERVDRPARTAFFVGCTAAYVRQNMAIDTAETLELLGVDYTVLSDEWCCGHPYIAAGQLDKARQSLEHTIAQYQELGVTRVVFCCPGCLKTFKHDAPQLLGRRLPFEAVHILEEIARLAEEGEIRFLPVAPKIVATYHDSCTLGRWLGVYEAPRQILRRIPGVSIREMRRNRNLAYCCGAGGLIRFDYPHIATRAGEERLREAEETGADTLVTSCPACLMQFQQTRSKLRSPMKVVDITELIWRQIDLPGKPQ